MNEGKPAYVSFLVRMWHESESSREWLIQVEHIPGGGKQYFNSLEEFFAALRALTGADANAEDGQASHRIFHTQTFNSKENKK